MRERKGIEKLTFGQELSAFLFQKSDRRLVIDFFGATRTTMRQSANPINARPMNCG
jgi:hypothetical protein